MVKRLVKECKGQRGARRKHVAWEITFHPTDATGAKCAFRNRDEMRRVANEALKEFSAKYALVGLHALQDIHILIINWGETGLALKSYLPNRSNPRRVMVAVADRIEKELNLDRVKEGVPPLITMKEVREKKRKEHGRPPLHDEIARHLASNKEPSVADILKAIADCGWHAMVKAKKIFISFTAERSSSAFELDLFRKGVMRAWLRKLAKEKEPRVEDVPYEQLIRALTAHRQGWEAPKGVEKWLRKDSTGMVEQPALLAALLKDTSADKDDYMSLKALLEIETRNEKEIRDNVEK